MQVRILAVAILATMYLPNIISEQQALFVRKDAIERGRRVTRQTSADKMVQNILQWIQGVYTQNSRRIRQGSFREYLPPTNTQKPRPFEPQPNGDSSEENNFIGYPPAGFSPQPPFEPSPPKPFPSKPPGTYPPATQPTGKPTEPPVTYPPHTYPTTKSTGYTYPSPPVTQPPTQPPSYETTQPPTQPPTQPTTPPPPPPSTPPPTYAPPTQPSVTFTIPTRPSVTYPPPTQPPTSPSSTEQPVTYPPPTRPPATQPPQTYPPATHPPTEPPYTYSPPTSPSSTYPSYGPPTTPESKPETETPPVPHYTDVPPTKKPEPEETTLPEEGDNQTSDSDSSEDLKHPPHIHAIDVECAKDMMTINIEFNRPFNGVIYSKGFYNNPECRYVAADSNQVKFSFTVSLNSCGTEFISAFDTQGQSYLENVLVLQNEAGIQEVWDTIRAVRCLWEGNLNKVLSVALSVGMLTQEIVTFSGDTAMAKLDIQMGKGPFAPSANGLVKIGEPMTLIVSVTGDPGFDIQVRDCHAKDAEGTNSVALTDSDGCVLKPKLFGAFQKTRNTGSTGASIIAYAFFNAFKFPDIMDLMIECNIELCKTDCEVCPDPAKKYEPGRKRRDLTSLNNTAVDPMRIGKTFRVILPEDLSYGEEIVNINQREVCMSTQNFAISSAILVIMLTISTITSAHLWLKNQRNSQKYIN